jgi:hypothetical protein
MRFFEGSEIFLKPLDMLLELADGHAEFAHRPECPPMPGTCAWAAADVLKRPGAAFWYRSCPSPVRSSGVRSQAKAVRSTVCAIPPMSFVKAWIEVAF